MIERTSTARAPWIPVAGNDKHHARVTVLREVCERLEQALHGLDTHRKRA